jgi:hypothetical protein
LTGLIRKHFFSTKKEVGIYSNISEFDEALEVINKCLETMPEDGPSKAMKDFIEKSRGTAPEDWAGFRDIDKKDMSMYEMMAPMMDDEDGELIEDGDEDEPPSESDV